MQQATQESHQQQPTSPSYDKKRVESLLSGISGFTERVYEIQRDLTAFKAVGPENGGQGEAQKSEYIEGLLRKAGVTDILHIDSEDQRVPGGIRPNFVATIPGKTQQGLWLFAHMDVVPEGKIEEWKSDPWTVVRKGDSLIGRGVEDNQQAIASMIVLAETLHQKNIVPHLSLHLVLVSDEECGNEHGMKWLLGRCGDFLPKDDIYIVPDGGSMDGADIEIAEKTILQLKVTIDGKSCHASMPDKGENAFVAGSEAALTIAGMGRIFRNENWIFDPPRSTFTPTMHESNSGAVNIIPGRDVFYVDCRLIPGIDPKLVLAEINKKLQGISSRRSTGITVEVIHNQPSSSVLKTALSAKVLFDALKLSGITPKFVGIGGGTVAALLRERGIDAVVWSTLAGKCHEPNEWSSISATLRDAQVLGLILMLQY